MLARLRENLSFKLLALVAAIMLHMYVASQQNPSQTKTVTVPIAVKDLPPGLIPGKPGPVMVNLTGTSDELAKVADMNVVATVDLKHAHIGQNTGLPVDVELTPSSLNSSIGHSDFKPRSLVINIEERRRRKLPVTVEVSGASAPGFVTKRPSLLVPSTATATGPANDVDSIARLVVKPDITGATDTVDDDYQIVPVDSQGNDVANVQIIPETAHVQIGVVETGRTKEVFITPKITGTPAAGFEVGTVTVKPETVMLSGSLDQLTGVANVLTEPIDITGASAVVTKQVTCLPPAGITLSPGQTATVTIQIVSAAPVSPPAPTQPAIPVPVGQ